jgi:glycosyltransferase involved in cell wall biosynthesis
MKLCLVSPYALSGSHPVGEHIRGVAGELAERGHRVTVLAPSGSTRALRSGRRRLRALQDGDDDALVALPGEPLAVAVGPALPLRARGRRRGAAFPVAAAANVAHAVTQGGFDLVHAYEPLHPGPSAAAVKHARGLTVATFHTAVEPPVSMPLFGPARDRRRAHLDALIATSEDARRVAAAHYPGDYIMLPLGVGAAFAPGDPEPRLVVCEWTPDSRPVVRALVRLVAADPRLRLTLLWNRRTRRPLRPYVPPAARGRVHAECPEDAAARAEVLGRARAFVAMPGGDPGLAWEARASGAPVVAPAGPRGEPSDLAYAPDQPALAAAAVARVLEDQALHGRLAREGRERASSRTHAAIAERLEALYAELGARRRADGRARVPARRPIVEVDFHMHTSASYDCATDPEALVDHCIAEGLDAIAITDHNEVDGALAAAALGKPITIVVGEEVKTAQGEVIGLFLHERIEPGQSMGDTIAAIHDQGGLVYMPHPFDRLHTIPDPAVLLRHLDEIDIFEVYNSRLVFESFNEDALRFAAKYNLLQAAGSDAHVLPGIGTALNRMPAFDGPEELLLALRSNEILRRPKSLLYLQGLKWVQQVAR